MLKVRTLFSGIGAPESALKNLGVEFELVDFCEIDIDAIISYGAMHVDQCEHFIYPSIPEMRKWLMDRNIGWDFEKKKSRIPKLTESKLKQVFKVSVLGKNLGDVSLQHDTDMPYADMLVWGFPCTDISVAGKQKGIVEGETRSGMYYEGFRILKNSMPKYSIIENVKNLTGKQFKEQFKQMLEDIDEIGYNNYWQVLNAKNYGIPQNRERVFVVSIRKDVDDGFEFPQGFDNGLRLKDMLEDEVDEKFYISNEKVEKLISQLDFKNNACEPILFGGEQKNQAIKTDGISTCLTSSMGTGGGYVPMVTDVCIPCITPDRVEKRQNGRRFKEDGDPSFTLTSQDRHGVMLIDDTQEGFNGIRVYDNEVPTLRASRFGLKVVVKEATKLGYAIAEEGDSINIAFPNSDTRMGRVQKECAGTLETSCNQAIIAKDKPMLVGGIGEKNFGSQYRQGNRIYDSEAIAMCLHAQPVGNAGGNSYLYKTDYRIRKLTPKECFRLMGFSDEEFQRCVDAGVSNSQLYKQAGNSIVTDVLYHIFSNLLPEEFMEKQEVI